MISCYDLSLSHQYRLRIRGEAQPYTPESLSEQQALPACQTNDKQRVACGRLLFHSRARLFACLNELYAMI